tara:strand:- start:128 stop:325 length:198 start_codon:yes stop_codon:yes gene_type:complete
MSVKYTRRHYVALAKEIRSAGGFSDRTIKELCKYFKEDNPRFKEHVFVKACRVEPIDPTSTRSEL